MVDLLPKIEPELVVPTEMQEKVVMALCEAAQTPCYGRAASHASEMNGGRGGESRARRITTRSRTSQPRSGSITVHFA